MTLSIANAEAQLDDAVVYHASLVSQYQSKFTTMETASIQGNDGDFGAESLAAMQGFRNQLNQLMSKESVQAILLPKIKEMAKAIGAPGNLSVSQMFFFLKKYYGDTPRKIKSRGITFDVAFTTAGTGSGILVRQITDKWSVQIEGCHVESAKTCECTQDQLSLGPIGRHNEKFLMEGQPVITGDNISKIVGTVGGSDSIAELQTVGTVSKVLKNGNFTSNNSSGTVTTMFPNWTLDSTTGVAVDTTTVHIADNNLTPASVKISTATRSLTQTLPKLDPNRPYLPIVAYNRAAGSAPAGTEIKVSWGSKTQTLTLGGAETGFDNYFVPDRDQDLWPDNFYEDQADFKVEIPTLASGYINISMFHLYPMTKVDGTWWAIIPGTTPFQKADNFGNIADSFSGSDSLIQRFLFFAFGEYLYHHSTPDHADPSLP